MYKPGNFNLKKILIPLILILIPGIGFSSHDLYYYCDLGNPVQVNNTCTCANKSGYTSIQGMTQYRLSPLESITVRLYCGQDMSSYPGPGVVAPYVNGHSQTAAGSNIICVVLRNEAWHITFNCTNFSAKHDVMFTDIICKVGYYNP